MRKRRRHTPEIYVKGILNGDRVMLSQAITLVESTHPLDRELANEVIQVLMPHTGKSYRIGITGVPGVGKSTFLDSFGTFLTQQSLKVAVLAIDPSSRMTRGSILGDKTRMDRLSHNAAAYIRPSPTAGSLGGVTRKTRETLLLCEAAGFDVVCIETVGVGQSETAVREMVDSFLLLMLPNAGDELQGIKKGIMEMADLLIINKADGEFLPKARQARTQYSQALRLFPIGPDNWRPKVSMCSAAEDTGLEEVWEILHAFQAHTQANGYWEIRRKEQALQWMHHTIQAQLEQAFYSHPAIQDRLAQMESDVSSNQISPLQAAMQLLAQWKEG